MKDETKERLHDLKERMIHPLGHRGHRGGEPERRGKGGVERPREEHRVDEMAGSEFLQD